MRTFVMFLLLVGLLAPGSPLQAERRRPVRRTIFAKLWDVPKRTSLQRSLPPRVYDAYLRKRYPRYYGGFHVRHLQDIGIPSGDLGIRGNGIYWNAW